MDGISEEGRAVFTSVRGFCFTLQVPTLLVLEDISQSDSAGPRPAKQAELTPEQTMYTTIGVAGVANASVTVLPPRQLVRPVWYKFECASGAGQGASAAGVPAADGVSQSGWLAADASVQQPVSLWMAPARFGAMFSTPGPKPGSVLLVDALGRALRWSFTLLVRRAGCTTRKGLQTMAMV